MSEPSREGLAKVVGRGMSWAALATGWSKGASFAAQIVLGYLLSDGEWGVYAIAIAVAAFVVTFRDGGVRELLVQRGIDEYPSLRGPVFWIALVINATLALALFVGAESAANFYGQPEVRNLLAVLALALFLDTPAQLLRARLRIELRFAAHSRLDMATATIRYGGAIILAWQDFGVMSFVLPLPFISVFEWVALTLATGDNPVRSAPEFRRWPELLGRAKWVLLGTVTTVVATMGDYAVLGRLVPTAVLGTYYFAFQLSVHASMLAAASVNTVLMPTLARVANDIPRQSRATLRSLRALALVASPLSLGLTAVIAPLELVIWGGKWSTAVPCVQILGAMLPVRLSFMIATSSLKARAKFRRWAELALAQGLGLVAVALIAGRYQLGAGEIALAISAYWVVVSPIMLLFALRGLKIRPREALSALTSAWLIALASAAVCLGLDELMTQALAPLLRVAVLGITFVILFAILARTLLRNHLVDALSVLPRRIAAPVAMVLRLELRGSDPLAEIAEPVVRP